MRKEMISEEDVKDILIGIEDEAHKMEKELEYLTIKGNMDGHKIMKKHKKYLLKLKERYLLRLHDGKVV